MKSPFKDNFNDARDENTNEVVDTRTKEEIKVDLQKEKVKLAHNYKAVGKFLLLATYLIIRSLMPMSLVLKSIYIDKVLSVFGILTLIPCVIFGVIIIIKEFTNMILYSSNQKKFFSFFEYHLHVPYDYEEKLKPIISFKKVTSLYALHRTYHIIVFNY